MDIHQIIGALGRGVIAERVGVTPNAVTEARRTGLFPASWYPDVTDLGEAKGVEVPMDVFRWKSAITDTNTTRGETQRESGVKGK